LREEEGVTDIIKLHQEHPSSDIAATLRRIADDIEAGKSGIAPSLPAL
jgi:hypothetical protein